MDYATDLTFLFFKIIVIIASSLRMLIYPSLLNRVNRSYSEIIFYLIQLMTSHGCVETIVFYHMSVHCYGLSGSYNQKDEDDTFHILICYKSLVLDRHILI